jgi:hypothetical protein
MQTDVTRRFIYAYQILRKAGTIKSGRQFAISLNYLPQSWNEILQGRRDIPLDFLHRACIAHQIDPAFLFSGEGDPFFQEHINERVRIRTVVVNDKAAERIAFVPVSALSAYPDGIRNAQFFEQLPYFNLPDFQQTHGTHRCFEVLGDQMEPSMYDGDRLICSYAHPDKWVTGIRDHYCYVIATKTEVVVRRVLNKLADTESLILVSDNNYYPPVRVQIADIQEVWLVIQKISPFLHSQMHQSDQNREQIAFLTEQMVELQKLMHVVSQKIT